jgi:hypothetical protein
VTVATDRLIEGRVGELRLVSSRPLTTADELDVDVTGPDGRTRHFPAFRVDARTWAISFLPSNAGRHAYRADSKDDALFRPAEGVVDVEVAPRGAGLTGYPSRSRSSGAASASSGGEVRLDWYDPRTFELFESELARADADGVIEVRRTEICALPSMEDWVLEVSPLAR